METPVPSAPSRWPLAVLFALALSLLILAARLVTRPAPAARTEAGPRIVALSPALAVTLRDLGLTTEGGGRIVGRHSFDIALDPSIPVCGDQSGIDYEALIRVRPTDVLTEWGTREIPDRLKSLAGQHHWTLHDYTQLKLDDVMDTTLKLGALYAQKDTIAIRGTNGEGVLHTDAGQDSFIDLVQRMHAAWSTPHAPIPAGRILLLESLDPAAAVGPGSFHQDILERLGGTPAIPTGKAYMTLDLEDILRLAPDGIVLLAPRPPRTPPGPAPAADALLKRLGRIGTLDIPAIRTKHIALIDDPCCLLPSSALLVYSEQLEAILKGWAAP